MSKIDSLVQEVKSSESEQDMMAYLEVDDVEIFLVLIFDWASSF
jgi:hypothetical protein